ncbi:MAG: hypothetical protein C4K58_00550 [Flavobacteriaceae bacterium]|nr:MAG: hypothetical protein C4K58_00550 [Flavobacteriaceae bacterium]
MSVNPTQTAAWKKLETHFKELELLSIQSLFENNPSRAEDFSVTLEDLEFDFSKHRLNKQTLSLLIELAKECKLLHFTH